MSNGNGYDGVGAVSIWWYVLYYICTENYYRRRKDGVVNFEVEVTNTGDTYAGKDVIQLYCETPYTPGGTEKSKVVLCAFWKDCIVTAGWNRNLQFHVALEDIASYDETAADGNGAYVLDAGDYAFYLSEKCTQLVSNWLHRMQKNIFAYALDSQIVYDESNKRSSDEIVASNQFLDAENDIQKLSRANGFANAEETIFQWDRGISRWKNRYHVWSAHQQIVRSREYQGELLDNTTGADKSIPWMIWQGVP